MSRLQFRSEESASLDFRNETAKRKRFQRCVQPPGCFQCAFVSHLDKPYMHIKMKHIETHTVRTICNRWTSSTGEVVMELLCEASQLYPIYSSSPPVDRVWP